MSELKIGISTSDLRREQLMLATVQAVARWGYADTTVAKVAKLANLTHGAVAYHFKSKDIMLKATFERMVEKTQTQYDEIIQSDELTALEKINAIIKAETVSKFVDRTSWFQYWINMYAHPEFRLQVNKLDEYMRDTIEALLCELNEDRSESNEEAVILAEGLTALLIGLWQTGQYRLNRKRASSLSPDSIGEKFLAWSLAGQQINSKLPTASKRRGSLQRHEPTSDDKNLERTKTADDFLDQMPTFIAPIGALPEAGHVRKFETLSGEFLACCTEGGQVSFYLNQCPRRGCKIIQNEVTITAGIFDGKCRGCQLEFEASSDVDKSGRHPLIKAPWINKHGLIFVQPAPLEVGAKKSGPSISIRETGILNRRLDLVADQSFHIANDWKAVVFAFLFDDFDPWVSISVGGLSRPRESLSLGSGSSIRRYSIAPSPGAVSSLISEPIDLSIMAIWPNVIIEFWPDIVVAWYIKKLDFEKTTLHRQVFSFDGRQTIVDPTLEAALDSIQRLLQESRMQFATELSFDLILHSHAELHEKEDSALFHFLEAWSNNA